MSDECGSCCGSKSCQSEAAAAMATAEKDTSTTLLAVPDMCCPTEFSMVDKELRRIVGVRDVTPDFVRKRFAFSTTPFRTTNCWERQSGPVSKFCCPWRS